MKIRFAIISPDLLEQVRSQVDELSKAVSAGDPDGMDTATEKLLTLTADACAVELTEEQWHVFLDEIRTMEPDFQSSYLLPGPVCASILPAVTVDDYVLELPVDDDTDAENTGV